MHGLRIAERVLASYSIVSSFAEDYMYCYTCIELDPSVISAPLVA